MTTLEGRTMTTLLNSPARGMTLPGRVTPGSVFRVPGKSGKRVSDYAVAQEVRFFAAEDCEDFDWFEYAQEGCTEILSCSPASSGQAAPRILGVQAERSRLAVELREQRRERQQERKEQLQLDELYRLFRSLELISSSTVNPLHKEYNALSHCPNCGKALYRQIWTGDTYDLSQNDSTCHVHNCYLAKGPGSCLKCQIPYNEHHFCDCSALAVTGWQQVLSTRLAGWPGTGNSIFKHPSLDLFVERYGNAWRAWATRSTTEAWLSETARQRGITVEYAEKQRPYWGCLGGELYRYVAGEW
jgi:hypothetical protein